MPVLPLLLACTLSPKEEPPGLTDSASSTPSTTGESTIPTGDTDSPTDTTPTDTGPALTSREVDDDGDGYTERAGDCDDEHSSVNPGVPEDCATWANDNCAKGPNEGCKGTGVWARTLEVTWTDSGDDLSFVVGRQIIGTYGLFVCRYEALALGSEADVPPCPDCEWTFQAETLADGYSWEGPCEELVDLDLDDTPPFYQSSGPWGFSYTHPSTGEISDVGWLSLYTFRYGVDQWLPQAGPGMPSEFPYWYEIAHVDGYHRVYSYERMYEYWYDYWRYGEPTRAYNP